MLRVMTYNVRMQSFAPRWKNKKRADAIMRRIRSMEVPPHVIVFTELFTKPCLNILLHGRRKKNFFGIRTGAREGGLADLGYRATSRPGHVFNLRNGGVVLFCLDGYSASDTKTYRFNIETAGSSAHQAKGAGYARISLNRRNYHVFGTHLQHNCSRRHLDARRRQLRELGDFIHEKVGQSGEPVVVAGDFNVAVDETGEDCARMNIDEIPYLVRRGYRSSGGVDLQRVSMDPREPTTMKGKILDHVFVGSLPDEATGSVAHRKLWDQDFAHHGDLEDEETPETRYFLSDHHPLLAYAGIRSAREEEGDLSGRVIFNGDAHCVALVFTAEDESLQRSLLTEDGRYQISLPAGRYRVEAITEHNGRELLTGEGYVVVPAGSSGTYNPPVGA